jgi:hypothetical protein
MIAQKQQRVELCKAVFPKFWITIPEETTVESQKRRLFWKYGVIMKNNLIKWLIIKHNGIILAMTNFSNLGFV